jgi:hypothetical protein
MTTRRRRASGQSALFVTAPLRQPAQPPIEDAIKLAGLPMWDPEFVFAPPRRWAFDYAWPPWRIALEIEGGTFGRYIVITSGYERRGGVSIPIKPGTPVRLGGRHNTGDGLENDAEKYNRAAILGWLVIRATTPMVKSGAAIATLREAFSARGLE